MDAVAAIVATLAAAQPVVDLVADRLAPVGMANGLARPNVILQQISGNRGRSNDGPTGQNTSTVQLTCSADDYPAAKAVAAAAAAALDGFTGSVAGVTVQRCLLEDDRDAPKPPEAGRPQSIAGVVLAFAVTWFLND